LTPSDDNCDGVTTCGETLWSRRWGADRDEVGRAVAVGGLASDVVVTGFYRDALDFGSGALGIVDNSRDIFVNKLDQAGNHLWSIGIVGDDHLVPRALAASSQGEVALVATVRGPIEDFGFGTITGKDGHDLFVTVLEANGKPRFAQRAGDGYHQYPMGVAFDHEGNIVVAGYFRGVMEWPSHGNGPDGEEPYRFESSDLDDSFVMKLAPDGGLLWFKLLTGSGGQYLRGVALDAAGNIAVVGYFFREIDAGGGAVLAEGDAADAFLVGLGPDGEHRYTRRFGGASDDRAYDVAFDSHGRATLVGRFEGNMLLGGQLVDAAAAGAIFVIKIDADGRPVFGRRYGGTSEQGAYGIAIDSRDRIVVSGYYEGSPSFGGDPLPATGLREPNILLLKLEPDGRHLWSRGFDVVGNQDTGYVFRGWRRVAIGAADQVLLTGFVRGALSFDPSQIAAEAAGGTDIFLAAFQP
jgi:hypothetical protein